jgi:hypothetical protein
MLCSVLSSRAKNIFGKIHFKSFKNFLNIDSKMWYVFPVFVYSHLPLTNLALHVFMKIINIMLFYSTLNK